MFKDFSRKAEMSVRERRAVLAVVVVAAVVLAGCPSPAAALVSDLEPLKQIRTALTLVEDSLIDLDELVTEHIVDNTTSSTSQSITNGTTPVPTTSDSIATTTPNTEPSTPPTPKPTTTTTTPKPTTTTPKPPPTITTTPKPTTTTPKPTTTTTTPKPTTTTPKPPPTTTTTPKPTTTTTTPKPTTTTTPKPTTTTTTPKPTTTTTTTPEPTTSVEISVTENERGLDEEAVEEVRSRLSVRNVSPHQIFTLVRDMFKAEILDDLIYDDYDPESESLYEDLQMATNLSSMAPNATQPTDMPLEPWWTRVNVCLMKMANIMTEVNEGSVDYEHAAQLTQEAENMDDLVQEGSDNPDLITSEEGYDEDVYQSLFLEAEGLLKNATRLVDEKINDAEEKQETERIVTIVMLSILFVVVLMGLVVALIKPNSKRSGFKKAKRSKRAEGQDIPEDESRTVSDSGAKYVQHSFHHQYDRSTHV